MAGRNPDAAFRNYKSPIGRALDCITPAQVTHNFAGRPNADYWLALADGQPVPLSGKYRPLELTIQQRFRIVEAQGDRGPFRATITEYVYMISERDGPEIISYHYHADAGSKHPHLHLKSGAGDLRQEFSQHSHMPSGRVSIEHVIGALIREFGVAPRKDDWEHVLDSSHSRFSKWKNW